MLGLKKKYLDIFASIEIEQEKVNTSNRVLDYWIASHKGKINVNGSKLPKDGKFGISIKIYQSKKDYNIVNIIKPMVDGLISSLHSEKQIDSESVKRISNLSGVNKHDVEKFLKNPHFAALGERNLVSNYRNGIKWNPQDDLCEYLEIYPVIDRTRNDVLIRAFFFNI